MASRSLIDLNKEAQQVRENGTIYKKVSLKIIKSVRFIFNFFTSAY